MPEDRGIKIGSNLNTNTDLELNFTSEYSSLKIYKWADVEIATNGSGDGSLEIAHDLSYTPIAVVFRKFTAQYTFLSATTYPNAFHQVGNINSYGSGADDITYESDDEKITITIDGGTPSTTYYFRYFILVDLSEAFSGVSNIALTGNYGFKVSKPGVSVLEGKEYQMDYSSKYKALQYYDDHILSSSLTLPAMWATIADSSEEEATYVDFNHNLTYPPFFLVYSDLETAYQYEVPYYSIENTSSLIHGITEISAWCDASRVRVLFRRKSNYFDSFNDNGYSFAMFDETTISVKVIIFAENLMGLENP